MSRFLLGSPAAPGDAPAPAGPGASASPALRAAGAGPSDQHSDEEPDWMRLFSPPPAAAAVPLPESSSEDDIMPVRKLVARAADEAGPSRAPAAPKGTAAARASVPDGPAAKTPGAKAGKAPKEKPTGPVVSVPLLFPDRLAKGKVLVELEGEGDAVDLEGDVGAVGRLYVAGGAGKASAAAQPELRLDLKGVIYEARMVACTSCMVVRIEHQEAKVEAVMNQYMAVRREAFTGGDDDGLEDGFAFGDTSSSGGSAKRKRHVDTGAGASGGGGGSDDDDGGSSDSGSGGKAKKSAKKKARTPKAGAAPRSKGPKPKGGKAKAKPKKKIKVNR